MRFSALVGRLKHRRVPHPNVAFFATLGWDSNALNRLRSSHLSDDREQRPRIGVVAEGLALVDEQIAIAGSEDKAGCPILTSRSLRR
jgi:hypothetical protein